MEPKTILIIISTVAILAGIYAIYASIKNTHKNHSQRRLKHRLVQKILGINGARIFYGFLGSGLIAFGIFMLFQFLVKPKLGQEYNNKTNKFVLVSKTTTNDQYIMNSSITTTLDQLQSSIKVLGKEKLYEYVEVSFKDNYLESIPEITWEMKNLEVIDLTYNNIHEIDINKISGMEKLKTIILTNNPISSEKIEEIKTKTNLEIKY